MNKKSDNLEMLNHIYQVAQMGIVGIDSIESEISDQSFRNLIKEQRREYREILTDAAQIFTEYGKDEKEISKLAKIASSLMVTFKTIKDSSTSNLSKMMIEGSNKGIIELTENLNKYKKIDKDIERFAKRLLKIIEQNVESLKKHL